MLLTTSPSVSRFWSRARPIAQVAAIALLLGGCGTLRSVSAGPRGTSPSTGAMSFLSPSLNASTFYITDRAMRSVRKDYLDRYACASGAVLHCACTARLAEECDCHC